MTKLALQVHLNMIVKFDYHTITLGIYRQFRLELQDRRIVRNYGRGPRGWRIRAPIPASWGPRISAIIAASQQGIQLYKTTARTTNGERLIAFARDQLVSILNPYNGENPNSIDIFGMLTETISLSISISISISLSLRQKCDVLRELWCLERFRWLFRLHRNC